MGTVGFWERKTAWIVFVASNIENTKAMQSCAVWLSMSLADGFLCFKFPTSVKIETTLRWWGFFIEHDYRDFQSQEHAIIVQRGCVYVCGSRNLVLSCFGGERKRFLSQMLWHPNEIFWRRFSFPASSELFSCLRKYFQYLKRFKLTFTRTINYSDYCRLL